MAGWCVCVHVCVIVAVRSGWRGGVQKKNLHLDAFNCYGNPFKAPFIYIIVGMEATLHQSASLEGKEEGGLERRKGCQCVLSLSSEVLPPYQLCKHMMSPGRCPTLSETSSPPVEDVTHVHQLKPFLFAAISLPLRLQQPQWSSNRTLISFVHLLLLVFLCTTFCLADREDRTTNEER